MPEARSLGRLYNDETALIDGCRKGDSACWEALIRRYEKSVYRFAYTLCRNYDDAADIAGQVFVRLYENIRSFRCESNFTSWLFRIVRNVYVDTCIRAPHRGHLSLEEGLEIDGDCLSHEVADGSPGPEECYLERETKAVLDRAIRHLPGYQRRVMEMYHAEGRSYEEIAHVTGLSLGTVKSRLSRARHMLRERLACLEDSMAAS
jgi:RNA polymerase sigma-70 factor (ECF subfamily)